MTPPCRNREFPQGVPWASSNMKKKMKVGNSHSKWLASLVSMSSDYVFWWIENPDSSWIWSMREWRPIIASMHSLRVDYCRFGMPWRKRTKFVSNVPGLRHDPIFCTRDHKHTVLRGCSPSGMLWTLVAEPYPFPLADILASASCVACKWHPPLHIDIDTIACRACARV